uniref:Uncharacterized protein n=1 Tax=Oryzias latipes TaxID=8090 RepID=A0A3P9KWR2_ORYLA
MSTSGSPSSSAELCRPARSPGKAGRSRAPAARSYSNTCFQTEEDKVLIDWELLRADVFLQSGGIGALREESRRLHQGGVTHSLLFMQL